MSRAARRRAVLATAGLLILGTAGGVLYAVQHRGVDVAVPAYSGHGCDRVGWPATVSGRPMTAASPRSPRTAAWGDPAVVARCGLPALAPTTEECLDVDGVGWVVQRLTDGARFTTYGTDPAIEVLVPAAYAPEPLLLPAFAPAARALPRNGRHCS